MATVKEIDIDGAAALFGLNGMECRVLIQPTSVETDGLKEIKGEFDKKSPSQRMRGVMFVLWKYLTDTQQIEVSFDFWYLKEMDKIINDIKSRLPDQIV